MASWHKATITEDLHGTCLNTGGIGDRTSLCEQEHLRRNERDCLLAQQISMVIGQSIHREPLRVGSYNPRFKRSELGMHRTDVTKSNLVIVIVAVVLPTNKN